MADQMSREGASFSAILGHEGPKAHLKAAIVSGQLGHAYLLEGTRGIGKKMHLSKRCFASIKTKKAKAVESALPAAVLITAIIRM